MRAERKGGRIRRGISEAVQPSAHSLCRCVTRSRVLNSRWLDGEKSKSMR